MHQHNFEVICVSIPAWSLFFIVTLKPNSPGFSGSKSYSAVQQGCRVIGVLAGDFIGDGSGDAVKIINIVSSVLAKNVR